MINNSLTFIKHQRNIQATFLNDKPKRIKKPIVPPKPTTQERAYQKSLLKVVALINLAVKEMLIPELPSLTRQAYQNKQNVIKTDDFTGDLEKIMFGIKLFLDRNVKPDDIATQSAKDTTSFQRAWFAKQMKHSLGIDVFVSAPWLQDHLSSWVGLNTALIKNLQDKALSDIQFQVQNGFTQGIRPESIAKNIYKRVDVTKSRAKLIARDQTSKLNSQLNQLHQKEIGVEKYVWQTAEDERVRTSHAEKQGKIYSWDNPPADTGNPGNDVNCRCIALPVFTKDMLGE